MKKLLSYFTPFEWSLWGISSVVILAVFFLFGNTEYHYLAGSLIGVTSLIFVAKGNPIGQILIVFFSIFYGIVSWSFRYYGEMITYLFMCTPIAIASIVTWFKNPYGNDHSQIKINEITKKEYYLLAVGATVVTIAFYFILKAFDTNNLIVSTLSVLTSFVAAYLMMRRCRFYAIAYALNDVVLILLWILASLEDTAYVSMVCCFIAFLANDIYGFISWTKLQKNQKISG